MSHNIAGIYVHKKLLVVVVTGADHAQNIVSSRRFGTGHAALGELRD